MKVLFISGTLPPENSATAGVLQKIISSMQQKGCEISGLTVKQSFHEASELRWDDIYIYRANTVLSRPRPIRGAYDFLYAAKNKVCSIFAAKRKNELYRERVVRALVRAMRKLPIQEYDVVIAACAYYEAAEALMRYKGRYGLKAKLALYQVDPLAENEIYLNNNESQLQTYEKALYQAVDHVFTTPIIYKTKEKLGWDMSSVTAVEFPLSLGSVSQKKPNSRDEIRCVYAGYLYGKLRDASFTLDLFSKLTDPRIRLYIVGKGQEQLLRTYESGQLKGRMLILGEKTATECDEILSEADVLINIGNTVSNQVPSKLLHYISFGKPILNITACKDCPTLSYTKRYPLSLDVADTKTADEKTVKTVCQWLQENYQRTVEHVEIMQLFEDCTPGFIAQSILTKIKGKER